MISMRDTATCEIYDDAAPIDRGELKISDGRAIGSNRNKPDLDTR